MLIQDRIQMILKMHSLSPSAFADKIGVQRSNVSHILSGRNKPSLDFLNKIVANFPRVNAHWLLTGSMPNASNSSSVEVREEEQSIYKSSSVTRKQIVKIITFYNDDTFDVAFPSEV